MLYSKAEHYRKARPSCLGREEGIVQARAPRGRHFLTSQQVFILLEGRKKIFPLFQERGRSFGRGQEGAEFFQQLQLAVELVKPKELALLVDLQEPPLSLGIDAEVERAGADSGLARKFQHSVFNLGRRGYSLRGHVA